MTSQRDPYDHDDHDPMDRPSSSVLTRVRQLVASLCERAIQTRQSVPNLPKVKSPNRDAKPLAPSIRSSIGALAVGVCGATEVFPGGVNRAPRPWIQALTMSFGAEYRQCMRDVLYRSKRADGFPVDIDLGFSVISRCARDACRTQIITDTVSLGCARSGDADGLSGRSRRPHWRSRHRGYRRRCR